MTNEEALIQLKGFREVYRRDLEALDMTIKRLEQLAKDLNNKEENER